MTPLEQLRQASEQPHAYARRWKERTGGKVVGYCCSYTPQELISAVGALPWRIVDRGIRISRADAHLQSYSCRMVRGALEEALAGRLDFLDGAVFPHTCDAVMRLSDIWRMNTRLGFHVDMILPAKLDTDSAVAYMAAVVRRFKTDLEKHLSVPVTDLSLREAIRAWNRVRRALAGLQKLRLAQPRVLCGSDWHAAVQAALVMDPHESAIALEDLARSLDDCSWKAPGPSPKRLVLSGGPCRAPEIYQWVEAAGGQVVEDDLCTGARAFDGYVDEGAEPMDALCNRFLNRPVCPAKHAGIHARGEFLRNRVFAARAQGVIFLLLKFCDPHAFDYPFLKTVLDQAGIPSLQIEIEDGAASEGQLRTRCEAFLEML